MTRLFAVLLLMSGLVGCAPGPRLLLSERSEVIDRSDIERPVGLDLTTHVRGLTAPTAIAFDPGPGEFTGSVLIAQGGFAGTPVMVMGYKPDGTRFDVYPRYRGFIFRRPVTEAIEGPVGGMVVREGEVFISHRDRRGMGMVSAFGFDGSRRTVVSELPARGDFGVTDLAFHPTNRRLYLGVGTATNSGVVGLDNWAVGWPREFTDFRDVPAVDIKLLGLNFRARNPLGGLFGGDDLVNTGPFQPFANSDSLRVPKSATGKPAGSIFSINPAGGDLRVEAHGLRYPRGLVFNEFGNLFVANNGMEMRGSRPVKDDPDAVLRIPPGGTWFGWPDFSADLVPVTDARFQPPASVMRPTGYPELRFLIDHEGSGLIPPDRATLVRGLFPSLSGAAKMTFVAQQPGFEAFAGQLLVALSGDRAPFATSGVALRQPVGYRVARVDIDSKQTSDFVFNTRGGPASRHGKRAVGLERPVDVKFGPDGALYILDFGRVDYRDGQPRVQAGTGRLYRLAPPVAPTTPPTAAVPIPSE